MTVRAVLHRGATTAPPGWPTGGRTTKPTRSWPDPKTPPGYKVPIATSKDLKAGRTGAVLPLKDAPAGLVRPGTWFTLEVIVRGNRITTKIDGKVAVDVVDENMLVEFEGCIGLQAVAGIVQFRNIEIKELPPRPAQPACSRTTRPSAPGAVTGRRMRYGGHDAGGSPVGPVTAGAS